MTTEPTTTVLTDDVTVTATLTRDAEGWTSTRQVPTFKIPCGVHAMRALPHAARIAADVLLTFAPDGTRAVLALSTPDDMHVATFEVVNGGTCRVA